MGGFYNSLHVRDKTQQEVIDAVKSLTERGACFVGGEQDGWTPVYAEIAYGMPLASDLSRQMQTDVVAIDIHDDDIFCYWYFRNGEEIDTYNSCPNYFGGSEMMMPDVDNPAELMQAMGEMVREKFNIASCQSPEEIAKMLQNMNDAFKDAGFTSMESSGEDEEATAGNPESFAELLQKPEDVAELAVILKGMREEPGTFVSMSAQKFFDLLRLPEALNSYEYIMDEGMPEGTVHVPGIDS